MSISRAKGLKYLKYGWFSNESNTLKGWSSFEILHCVVVICSDISEEHKASVIRVTELVQVDTEL